MKPLLFFLFLILSSEISAQDWSDFQTSYKYIQEGNMEEALKYLNKHLKTMPNEPIGYFNRGIVKYSLYGIDSAMIDLKSSEKLGYLPAGELARNHQKYGILINDDYKNELFKLKGVKERNINPVFGRKDSLRGTLSELRTCFDVKHYNLSISIDSMGEISGNNTITFQAIRETNQIQIDLFKNLRIKKILWGNIKLDFKREHNAVFIKFPQMLSKSSNESITVFYSGSPKEAIRPPWQGGFVLKRDKKNKLWYGVACERLGASSWWPNKDHLSDEPDSMTVTLNVPKGYQAISNGNLSSKKIKRETEEYVWKISNPINNYNVTFYIGDFTNYQLFHNENKSKPIDFYILKENLEQARKHFEQTLEVVNFYSEVFGEYPYWSDGMGVVESPFPGMEHQGAIAIGNDFSPNKESRYRNKKYDYLIVHEFAHEWWGNSVSAGDFADAWLHEGFATYSEYLFLERQFGHDEYLFEITNARHSILNFWPVVGNASVNDNTFVGGDIYTKGAQVLHNLRCSLDNDSLFFKILKTFATRYSNSIVETRHFTDLVNELSEKNYTPFFNSWLRQKYVPSLKYSIQKEGGKTLFTYKWVNVEDGFEMPFGIILSDNSKRLVGTTQEQTLTFSDAETIQIPFGVSMKFNQVPKNSYTYFSISK